MTIKHPIPDRILRLMPPDERQSLGQACRTLAEVEAENAADSEAQLQDQIIGYLRLRGVSAICRARMDKKSTMTEGWPDLTFVYKTRPVAIEVKIAKNKPSLVQSEVIKTMQSDGWFVYVAYSLTEVKSVLDEIDRVQIFNPYENERV